MKHFPWLVLFVCSIGACSKHANQNLKYDMSAIVFHVYERVCSLQIIRSGEGTIYMAAANVAENGSDSEGLIIGTIGSGELPYKIFGESVQKYRGQLIIQDGKQVLRLDIDGRMDNAQVKDLIKSKINIK